MHLSVDVESKLADLGQRVLLVQVIPHKDIVHFRGNLEFHSVIGSRDGIEVPLYESIALPLFNILNRNHGEEIDEDSKARYIKSSHLASCHLVFWN